jgi:hypothetical protein
MFLTISLDDCKDQVTSSLVILCLQSVFKATLMQSFMEILTNRGRAIVQDRIWALDRFPKDPFIIKCTFIPGQGWDIMESEATRFIELLNGSIVNTVRQPGDISKYGFDSYDIIWIEGRNCTFSIEEPVE